VEQLIGRMLGKYRIDALLGHGNLASVYRATDRTSSSTVALRVLDRSISSSVSFVDRFRQMVAAVSALQHPNLLPILDYGFQDGLAFLARPLITGGTLRARLGTPLAYAEADRLLRPIAAVLDYAHRQGLMHGDLKPGNILLPRPDLPLLADLGSVPVAAQANSLIAAAKGAQFGTPEYLAPEQVQGRQADARADLYALGVILYEALIGRPPFRAERPTDTPRVIALAHLSTPPPSPRSLNPALSPGVEAVLIRALAKRPEQRYPTGTDLFDALEWAQRHPAATIAALQPRAAQDAPPAGQADAHPAPKRARGWSRTGF
jgi:serine/threonine protein kinase